MGAASRGDAKRVVPCGPAIVACWCLSLCFGIYAIVIAAVRYSMVGSVGSAAVDFTQYASGCIISAATLQQQPSSVIAAGPCDDFYVFEVNFTGSARVRMPKMGAWSSRLWHAGVRDKEKSCSDTRAPSIPPKYKVGTNVSCWLPAVTLSAEAKSLYQCSTDVNNPDCYKLFDPARDLSSPAGWPNDPNKRSTLVFDDLGERIKPLIAGLLLLFWFFCFPVISFFFNIRLSP